MKMYVIRSVGWVFDDSSYNFDGEHELVGVYSTRKEATEKQKELNHQYFLEYFWIIYKFQLNIDSFSVGRYVNAKKIVSYIARQLKLEESQLWRNEHMLNDSEEIRGKITPDIVSEILENNNFTFFKIIEFDSSNIYFYHFKRNPVVWRKVFEESLTAYSDHFHYFYDERDTDFKRAVGTIKECYEFALIDHGDPILYHLRKRKLVQGKLKELSDTPELLNNTLKNLEGVNYDFLNECIEFNGNINSEELMMLDSLLKNPILIVEKIGLESLQKWKCLL